jgi:protein SCO1/2
MMAALALCAAAAGVWVSRQLAHSAPQLASGTWLEPRRQVGPFSLTDDTDRPFTQAQLAGAPTLVFFGFTHCPDVCPTTLYKLSQLQRAAVLPRLRVVFVTVDPQRDTPAALKQYLAAFAASPQTASHSGLVGLTGSEHAIETVAARFGVAYQRVALPGGDYTIDHSAVLFLLDETGHMSAVFTPPFDPGVLGADLKRAAPYLRG